MIAYRLLMGGGGSFPGPSAPGSIAPAPAGAWTEVTGPHAFYQDGRTYIGWVTGNADPNDIEVIARDDGAAPDVFDGPILLRNNLNEGASTVPDSHLGPAVIVRPDGHIVMAWCGHAANTIYVKISNDPDDIVAGFSAPILINAAVVAAATYPQLSYLSANDRIYLTFRWQSGGTSAGFGLTYSDDGGETWDTPISIFEVPETHDYGCFSSNGVDRIDFAMTDGPADMVGGYGLYHWYIDETGDSFQSDGTPIAGSYALNPADLTELVPTSGGDRYPYSLSYQADGNPVIAVQTKNATPIEIGEYRWNGSTWTYTEIDTSELLLGSIESIGGGAHDWNDSERFISGKVISGTIYVYRYTRSGGIWTGQQIATATCAPSPVYVVNAGPELAWVWFSSDFTDSEDFDPAIAGGA